MNNNDIEKDKTTSNMDKESNKSGRFIADIFADRSMIYTMSYVTILINDTRIMIKIILDGIDRFYQ